MSSACLSTHLHEPHTRLCPQRRCPQPPAREQALVGSGVVPATPAPSTARSLNLLPSDCSTDHLDCESPSGHLLTAITASSLNPIPLHSLFWKGPVSLEMTFPVPRPLSFQSSSPPVPAFSACLSWLSASPCAVESRTCPRRQHSVARASLPAFSAHSFPFFSLADPSASPNSQEQHPTDPWVGAHSSPPSGPHPPSPRPNCRPDPSPGLREHALALCVSLSHISTWLVLFPHSGGCSHCLLGETLLVMLSALAIPIHLAFALPASLVCA